MGYAKPLKSNVRSQTNDFYGTYRWKMFSKNYKRLNPLCLQCERDGRLSLAKVTDHIIPMKTGGAVWDERNIQGLCKKCDNRKRAFERIGNLEIDKVRNDKAEWVPLEDKKKLIMRWPGQKKLGESPDPRGGD